MGEEERKPSDRRSEECEEPENEWGERELDETTQIADMNVEGMPWYRRSKPLYPDSGLAKTEMSKKETFRFAVSATLAGLLIGLVLIGGCALFLLFCTQVWLR